MGRLAPSIPQRDARELALALRMRLLPGEAWLAVKKGLQGARTGGNKGIFLERLDN